MYVTNFSYFFSKQFKIASAKCEYLEMNAKSYGTLHYVA